MVRRSSRTEAVKLSNRLQKQNNGSAPSNNGTKNAAYGKESPDRDSSTVALTNLNHSTDDSKEKRPDNLKAAQVLSPKLAPPAQTTGQRSRGLSTTPGSLTAAQNQQGPGTGRVPVTVHLAPPQQPSKTRRSAGGGAATTVALLCISFYYIITTIPLSILEYLKDKVQPGSLDIPISRLGEDPQWRWFFAFFNARFLVVDFALSHYAIFFYIYLLTSPAFRNATIKVLAGYLPCIFGGIHQRIVRAERMAVLETLV